MVRRPKIGQLVDVHPFHVAAFVKELQKELSPPTVKQHLAALRMLFDWLVTGHVLDVTQPSSRTPPGNKSRASFERTVLI